MLTLNDNNKIIHNLNFKLDSKYNIKESNNEYSSID